ncbi:hypothetical protein OY671_008442 [Metschnikowia pulcherrima]|nr:hypothetical protein OY671_008442 [Metschnikowia pulcherrima]
MGAIIHYLEVPSFIVTSAGMFSARGMCFVMTTDSIPIDHPFYTALQGSFYRLPGGGRSTFIGCLMVSTFGRKILVAVDSTITSRMTFRLASIVEADQGRHDADWHRDHAERVAYYTDDRDDALGSAKSLSDNMVRPMTHEDQQRAYNAGWNCGRWPDDPRYQGCEPTNPDLWEHYEDGKADGYVERRRNERGV